jgi:hypothetical protein
MTANYGKLIMGELNTPETMAREWLRSSFAAHPDLNLGGAHEGLPAILHRREVG